MNNVRRRVGFRRTPTSSRLDIEALELELTEVYVGAISRRFIERLTKSPSGAVFNPWWQVDRKNDVGRNAPGIRRKQLRAYFCERLGNARLAVIGEALGYRGGHFSGIPMTSERILLGKKKDAGVEPHEVFRTSPRAAQANVKNAVKVFLSRRQRLSGARC
jgi:hypothetical protein